MRHKGDNYLSPLDTFLKTIDPLNYPTIKSPLIKLVKRLINVNLFFIIYGKLLIPLGHTYEEFY